MKTIAFAALVSIVLTGCVGTPYKISERAEKLQTSMTRDAASQVVSRNVPANERQLGLCAHSLLGPTTASGGFARGPAVLDGTTIRYPSVGIASSPSHVSGNILGGTGVLHIKSSIETWDEAFELTELDRVSLGKGVQQPTCRGRIGGTYVVLEQTSMKFGAKTLIFHIDDHQLDEFLAALTYLSPSTPVKIVGN